MKRGFKTWAEKKAEYYRKKLLLENHQPLSANKLADHLKVKILKPWDIPNIPKSVTDQLLIKAKSEWSAATLVLPDKHVVIFNPTHSANRYESDIVHELAHIICKHEPSKVVKNLSFPIPLRIYDREQEDEARWLGGCLNLPRSALLWAFSSGMDIHDCSLHFGVSVALVRYRKNVTGIEAQLRRRKNLLNR